MPWRCERCEQCFEPIFVSQTSVSGHVITTFATLCDECRWFWTTGQDVAKLPPAKTLTPVLPWPLSVLITLALYATLCLLTRGCW
jgi:hypothetical protein